jgi:tyrosyl-tRNA synthetase
MGKTASGAVWLDEKKTSPYEFYQYWVNADDRDVARFLAYFTFLPMEEIRRVEALQGDQLNGAKAVLAYEVTKLAHGEAEARKALSAAQQVFGGREIPEDLLPSSDIPRGLVIHPHAADATATAGLEGVTIPDAVPTTSIDSARMEAGIPAVELFVEVGLASSKSEARRLINQGGAYVNDERVGDIGRILSTSDLIGRELILRAGKKKHHRVVAK